MIAVGQFFISQYGCPFSLVGLAFITSAIATLGWNFAKLGEAGKPPIAASEARQATARDALRTAFGDRSCALLTLGYFVCEFQVVFIGARLTPYLLDHGVPARVGVAALVLIGLFNYFGTYLAGVLAGKLPKRYVLSFIYIMCAVVFSVFLLMPLSKWSVYLFAAATGFLWLSTEPPTNAIVAQVYGVHYLGMLGGIVFFLAPSRQLFRRVAWGQDLRRGGELRHGVDDDHGTGRIRGANSFANR